MAPRGSFGPDRVPNKKKESHMATPDDPSISLPRLLTIRQVADHTQFSQKQVRRWIDSGELKAKKIGRHWRIAENDLALFLATRTSR